MGIEALARWDHPVRGNVPPSIFIPIAEESGLIVALGRWVLRTACTELAGLRALGGAAADLRVSVNVSPRQLREHDFVEDVLGALRESGRPRPRPQPRGDRECRPRLRRGGHRVPPCAAGRRLWRVARRLRYRVLFAREPAHLPIDELKIDVSFVTAVLDGGVDEALVEAIVGLGAALGVSVVAEGIESAEIARG